MSALPAPTWAPAVPPDPRTVRLVLVSECAAPVPDDDYGGSPDSAFDASTVLAFRAAGLPVESVADLATHGVHLTTVLRYPKREARVPAAEIRAATPELAAELATFPAAVAWLLMGDVAIAAGNQIARERTGRRLIPAGSTYRIRGGDYRLEGIRLFPSYLQAGPAWFIERTKRQMIAEDIAAALDLGGIPRSD